MKKESAEAVRRDNWILCAFTVTSLILGALYVLWGWDGLLRRLTGQTMAAWVQAVGSIAAVIGAFVVANQQAEAARRDARAQFLRRMTAIGALFDQAVSFVDEVCEFTADAGSASWYAEEGYEPESVGELLRRLDTIDVASLESPDGVAAFFALRQQVMKAMVIARSICAMPNLDDESIDWVEHCDKLEVLNLGVIETRRKLAVALDAAGASAP